jgi:hypothetical protein
VIRILRVAVPSERTAIIGKNHREDQACLEKRSGQPHMGSSRIALNQCKRKCASTPVSVMECPLYRKVSHRTACAVPLLIQRHSA